MDQQVNSTLPSIELHHKKLKEILARTRYQLTLAKENFKVQADKHRSLETNFKVGDLVWLSIKNLYLHGKKKLLPRYVGPFQITQVINPVAVKLLLPASMKIHPVFHVSLLKPVTPGTRLSKPPTSVTIEGHQEFEVKKILDSKRVGTRFFYLIDWKGFGPEERSWEPISNVNNAPKLIRLFHALHPTTPRPVPSVLKRIFGGGNCQDSAPPVKPKSN